MELRKALGQLSKKSRRALPEDGYVSRLLFVVIPRFVARQV